MMAEYGISTQETNTGDLRGMAQQYGMLLRTARDFKDYTGGSNRSIKYDEQFAENLMKEVGLCGN